MRSPSKNVPKRSRLDPQDTTPVEGQPARSDVASDNPLFVPPFVGSRVAKGIPIDDIAEYLNLTALFRNQWGFRPENGEDDTEFKDRVRAVLREELAKAKEGDLLIPQVAYGHFAANAEGNDLVIWKDESRNVGVDALHLPPPAQGAVALHRRLLPLRPTRARRTSPASCCAPSATGPPRKRRGSSPRTATRTTCSCTASASRWPRPRPSTGTTASARSWLRRRGRPAVDVPVPPDLPGRALLVGLPGLPDLTDNAKVVELLGGERIGVTVSEGFQMEPEQTTDAIICHHPEAKYFVA